MPPTKPKYLYDNPWILVVTHGEFDYAENPLNIPEVFTNFSLMDKANTEDNIRQAVKENFYDFISAPESNNWLEGQDIVMYYIEFPDPDLLIEFEDILSGINVAGEEPCITNDCYHRIIKILPRCKQISFKYNKDEAMIF